MVVLAALVILASSVSVSQAEQKPSRQWTIISCNEREDGGSQPEPPVADAKPLGELPGLFTAAIHACAFEKLCKNRECCSDRIGPRRERS